MIDSPLNSYQLFRRVAHEWLDVEELSKLTFAETESLVTGVNMAISQVWNKLPPHYRRREHTVEVKASVSENFNVTAGSAVIAEDHIPPPDFFSSCLIAGDPIPYRLVEKRLLDRPYVGTSGEKSTQRFYDAFVLPWIVERVAFLRESNGYEWRYDPTDHAPRRWSPYYSRTFRIEKRTVPVFAPGDPGGSSNLPGKRTRSVLFLPTMTATPMTLFLSVFIRPEVLSLPNVEDEITPFDFDEEIAEYVIKVAGSHLKTHRRFRSDLKDFDVAPTLQEIDNLPSQPASMQKTIGTPFGW